MTSSLLWTIYSRKLQSRTMTHKWSTHFTQLIEKLKYLARRAENGI